MTILNFPRLLLTLSCITWSGYASAEAAAGPTAGLSKELRAAFIAEMQHLDAGLQRAVSAVARADWATVERTARGIRSSFILEQQLDPQQLAELHRVLPEHFLALDRRFHLQAERLALAAKSADAELATFSLYKLTEGCVSCHAQYAPHRFPSMQAPSEPHHHGTPEPFKPTLESRHPRSGQSQPAPDGLELLSSQITRAAKP